MAPTVFHAYARAVARAACSGDRASRRTANGNVAPMQSVIGSSVIAASAAPASGAPGPAPSQTESSGSRSASAKAPYEVRAIPS